MIQTLRLYATTLDDSTAGARKIAFLPYKAGTNTFATSSDWTPAAADFKVAKAVTGSGLGAEASIGTAPTWVNGRVVVILSGTELTCRYLTIRVENAAINSDEILVETYGNASAQYPTIYSGGGAGNVLSSGTGTDQLSVSGGRANADVVYWDGSAIGGVDTAGYPKVTIKSGGGAGEISLTSGAVNQVTTVTTTTDVTNAVMADVRYWSGIAVDASSFNATLAAASVASVSGDVGGNLTGSVGSLAAQAKTDVAGAVWNALLTGLTTVGSIGKKLKDWALGADNKALLSTDAQTGVTIPAVTTVGSVTGAVGSVTGNVGGSVASVTGAVGSVTGNVGGNVTGSVGSLATQAKTDVENAVWNGLQSGHTTAGTFGKYLDAPVSGATAPTAVQVRQEMDANSTQLAAIAGNASTAANQSTTANTTLTAIKGTGWTATDNLHQIRTDIGNVSGGTGGGTGSGANPVDHNGGAGVTVDGSASTTDILQYLKPDTSGADGLFVAAYLASEYDANPPLRSAKGTTRTGPDGRWLAPLMLDSGTYYVIADTAGDGYEAKINTVVVP